MTNHTSRGKVAAILCRRDGCTLSEAEERIDEVMQMMADVDYDPEICECIMACELGLEMDYIFDLLF